MTSVQTKLSKIIEIPRIIDEGYLCFAESNAHIPFDIKRIYYIYDVINNAVRGRHAHRETHQVLFCIQGSITITLDNGKNRESIILNKANQGIYLPAMMWHEMTDFKRGTILLVFASKKYEESDYIRDYQEFLRRHHDTHE